MEVQRYPQDYNGVVAGSPAINWTKLHPQQLWGPVMMNAAKNPPTASCGKGRDGRTAASFGMGYRRAQT
jgi:hypothetical protein